MIRDDCEGHFKVPADPRTGAGRLAQQGGGVPPQECLGLRNECEACAHRIQLARMIDATRPRAPPIARCGDASGLKTCQPLASVSRPRCVAFCLLFPPVCCAVLFLILQLSCPLAIATGRSKIDEAIPIGAVAVVKVYIIIFHIKRDVGPGIFCVAMVANKDGHPNGLIRLDWIGRSQHC